MGRAPCCEKVGLRRGRWTAEEDEILVKFIQTHGEGSWRSLPKNAGLLRCGKSCRLRWINYLRTDLKRGKFSAQEEDLIIKLHTSLGNRWSLIAAQLPGRTDNEIKNYWNSHLSRRIHTFLRPHNDAPIVIMNLSKLSNGIKRKTRKLNGKTNNEEMFKKGHSEVTQLPQGTQTNTIESTRTPCDTPLVSQETQRDAPDESIDLEAHGVLVETPDLVVKSHYQYSEENMSVRKVEMQNMMNACGDVPHEGLHINSVVCPSGIKESNEVWTFSDKKEKEVMGCCEERENGVMETNKRTVEEGESGVGGGGDSLSSNGETCELYSSSSMNSCVVGDEWIDMDWDSMLDRHLPWEGGELLTWLEELQC